MTRSDDTIRADSGIMEALWRSSAQTNRSCADSCANGTIINRWEDVPSVGARANTTFTMAWAVTVIWNPESHRMVHKTVKYLTDALRDMGGGQSLMGCSC